MHEMLSLSFALIAILAFLFLYLGFFYSIYLYRRGKYFGFKKYPTWLAIAMLGSFFVYTVFRISAQMPEMKNIDQEEFELIPTKPSQLDFNEILQVK